MATPSRPPLPFAGADDDDVALTIADLGVARAFWEGVPTARLLARVRLHRDEHDLVDLDERASGVDFADASWDSILARVASAAPGSLEDIKRRIARHARAASDEGPLPASDPAVAALIFAALSSQDDEASPAEGAADGAFSDKAELVEESVALACGLLDPRLGPAAGDLRAPVFEACLELATRGSSSETRLGRLRDALDSSGDAPAVVPSVSSLYPWGSSEVPVSERRACILERSDLERVLLGVERRSRDVTPILTEATGLLAKRGAVLLVMARAARAGGDVPRLPPASWFPADLGAPDAPKALASALERGATTAPRVRALLVREGDPALDAAGREMLDVASHPFASAVFAEILATISRERDVIRLVTYFAIAPDPGPAAHALSLCTARELPVVLRGWLESTLPRERLDACLAALAPYPTLRDAVKPLG